MRKFIVMLVLAVTLAIGTLGCDQTTPAQRVAAVQNVVNQTAALSQNVNASVVDLQTTVATSQAMLDDPNIPAEFKPKILATLQMVKSKLDAFLVQKQKIDALLAQQQSILNSVDLNNVDVAKEVQIYGQSINAIAPALPPPWNGYVYMATAFGIPFAAFVLTWLKKNGILKDLNDTKYVFTDAVTSVDALLDPANNVIPPEKVEIAKAVLSKNQVGATQDAVDAVHDPQVNTGPIDLK